VRQLTEKPPGERTAEETLALADAQAVDKRAQLAELARKIKLLPQFGRASSTAKIVAQFVQDRQVSTDALRMLAALPNEIGPDLLYSIWTGAREQDDLSKWIEQLLYSKDVRAHASPALDVALDLRQVTDCDKALTILVRAKEHGDRRSLVLLNRLHNKRGCGERKLDDCFTCLRKGDELKDATVAARTRKAP
jgi:hypothetical protein